MSLNDKLAAYFTEHPHAWIASDALAKIGGRCAWRTRISNLRRERGMTIENRQKRIPKHQAQCPAWIAWDIPQACNCGGQYEVFIMSEYRYVPAPLTTEQEHEDEKEHVARVDTSDGQPFLLTAPTVADGLEFP